MTTIQAAVPKKPENPLMSYMRSPKIYINLPSNGLYWTEGSVDLPENGLIPVFSMTAKDELLMKTPDALLNGQAVVDVIQSCIPNIKNAWDCPTVDIDCILIAIRIATFGEILEINHTVPNTDELVAHNVDLRLLLDTVVSNSVWEETVEIDDNLTVYIRPLTYKHMSQVNLKTFEAQRLLQSADNLDYTEEQKLEIYNASINMMGNLSIETMIDSIYAIEIPGTIVREKEFISEFLENADGQIYQKIQNHVAAMREKLGIRPIDIETPEEFVEKGAPAHYQIPITLDNSDFFVRGS